MKFHLYSIFILFSIIKYILTYPLKKDLHCVNLSNTKFNLRNVTNDVYVEKFIEGPCAPVILLPGYMGSKLEFKMLDTKIFAEKHNDIITKCGWTDLNAKEIQQFTLWINTDIDFMSIAMQNQMKSEKNKKKSKEMHIPKLFKKIIINDSTMNFDVMSGCYGSLIRNYFEINDNKIKVKGLEGAEIRILAKDSQKCGADSISNFLDQYSSFVKFTKGFSDIVSNLENLGYKHGISLFSFPYDWRLPPLDHQEKLNKTLNLSFTINKKKSILIGHSLGGLLAYNAALKNNILIEKVLTIGTPFLGSLSALKVISNQINPFNYKKSFKAMMFDVHVESELDPESHNMFSGTNLNTFTFLPKMRIKDEIDKNLSKSIKELFPSETDLHSCKSTINFFNDKTTCKVNDYDFYSSKSINENEKSELNELIFEHEKELMHYIKSSKYYNDVISKVEISSDVNNKEIFDLLYQRHLEAEHNDIFRFTNPNVPFIFIFSSHLPIVDLKLKDDKFLKNIPGDGTVDSLSQLYPGLRWYAEKNNKNLHFVEYCAEHSNFKKYQPEKSQYISLPCECLFDKSSPNENCNHATMLSDKYLVEFIVKVLKSETFSKIVPNEDYKNLFERKFDNSLVCKNLQYIFKK